MKLSTLCQGLGEITQEAEILNLCTDSRVAEKGDLFFCYQGEREDLHNFAESAFFRGAAAVMCERPLEVPIPQVIVKNGRRGMAECAAAFYGHPEKKMSLVGVTGTNGKTTTCHLLVSVLRESGREVGLIGTLGGEYKGRTVPPDLTTPDPVFLFSLLSDMRQAGVDTVVMEVSAHALALNKVAPILFDVGVFTNLTRDHLDFFGEMERYKEAKKKLFAPDKSKFCVFNADDPTSFEYEGAAKAFETYGLVSPADAFAVIEREDIFGTQALFNLSDELIEVNLSLPGRHNVLNALAASCAARHMGCSAAEISRGLKKVKSVKGRLEHVASYNGGEVFVDFAHTPDGLEKSLKSLKEHTKGRLFVLFGCGGNRDEGKRALMGETAAKYSDFAFLTSDNPRFEEPCAIIQSIEEGFKKISKNYVAVEEREKAIEEGIKCLQKGDVLLIAGKGAETYQEIMGIKYSFSDEDVVKRLLGKL